MRNAVLMLSLVTSAFVMSGCQGTSDPRNPAIQALQNTPNACGPAGAADEMACKTNMSSRWGGKVNS